MLPNTFSGGQSPVLLLLGINQKEFIKIIAFPFIILFRVYIDINFWASLQVGFLDFSLMLGSVFLSFFIGSSVLKKHLVHFRISE